MNNADRQKSLAKILDARIQAAQKIFPGEQKPENAVVAVISEFSFSSYVRALLQLHKRLGDEEKQLWKAGFTKMIFLLGNPEKILQKFDNAFIYRESGVALTGLLTEAQAKGFKSMCPLYDNIKMDSNYEYLGHWKKYQIEITEECTSVERFLVDLSHIINESLIDGTMASMSSISVSFRDYERQPYVKDKALYTRVLYDTETRLYKIRGQLYDG